jgi:hypothetical protein
MTQREEFPLLTPEEHAVLDTLRAAQVVETSRLAARPAKVWDRVATMEGVNAELAPIARMTFPSRWERLENYYFQGDAEQFRSTLLLFGRIPIDLHIFAFVSLTPGRGFLERSSSMMHREWIHERTLRPVTKGTEITDRVFFRCRAPGLSLALGPVIRFVFRHRHRQLRKHFCELTGDDGSTP